MIKQRIAQSFGRAASTYDAAADLQRRVGQKLLSRIAVNPSCQRVIDLGSGTGFFLEPVQACFPRALIIGVDISEEMLRYSRAYQSDQFVRVCADAEALPFSNSSVDFIFSNLSVQWIHNVEALLLEMNRILKPGGKAYLSTLAPDTLYELRQSWQMVDDNSHVNNFSNSDDLIKAAGAVFSVSSYVYEEKLCYRSPVELLKQLQEVGASEVEGRKQKGLMGKQRFSKFLKSYERFKESDYFPATYFVVELELTKSENL